MAGWEASAVLRQWARLLIFRRPGTVGGKSGVVPIAAAPPKPPIQPSTAPTRPTQVTPKRQRRQSRTSINTLPTIPAGTAQPSISSTEQMQDVEPSSVG